MVKKNVSCEGAHQRDREPMTAAALGMSLSKGQPDEEARSMLGRSEALVVTDRPARYGKQLVAHLSRHSAGHWSDSDQRGWIEFANGRAELSCGSDGLHLAIQANPDDLARLEDVVGRHLLRFGTRDQLHVRWSRSD